MLYLIYLLASILMLLAYFRIAAYFNIVDKPNLRSSHKTLTILGAGVIFPALIFVHSLVTGNTYPYFTSGLVLISMLSFYDDLRPLPSIIRLVFHLVAVFLLFSETGLNVVSVGFVIAIYVVAIGTINAYNFMDGINGMTALYSLITVSSLYFVNQYVVSFVDSEWLVVCVISLISFSIFNFRRVAKCFAGDVGSVSMAYIIMFFMIILMVQTEDLKYIGLLLIYGLDTVTTIIFRLIRKENIFVAHRSHFYQYLTNVRQWPHTTASALYAFLQLLVNIILISTSFELTNLLLFLVLFGIGALYLRYRIEGKQLVIQGPKPTS